ncbi:MAG: enoyl-CoA hydratase [Alphaproteobacteria bacterium]|nr:MAG: enoyl-CoA hydratase [Alphaproteobacteria bacterium]
MSEAPHLLFETVGNVGVITFNRPDNYNALTGEMLDLYLEALEACRVDTNIGAIVLTGAGKAFCGGGDVNNLGDNNKPKEPTPLLDIKNQFWEGLHRIPKKLAEIDKPVICAVNGPAYGAGVDMTLQCDLRFAADSAKFRITYTEFGLVPGNGGTYFLPRIVGESKALELFWGAELFTAQEAKDWGMVTKIFPREELLEKTIEWAQGVCERAPIPVRLIKRAVKQGLNADLNTSLDLISSHMVITRTSRDHAEGIKAYIEKRKPVFTGK